MTTTTRERPIHFSPPMAKVVHEGTKTQTRRVVKPQPTAFWGPPNECIAGGVLQCIVHDLSAKNIGNAREKYIGCPYGQPGDRLWVREAWAAPHAYDHLPPRLIPQGATIHYAATEDRGGLLWRPSIHMPRWASRTLLEVTAVRVERLQAISGGDGKAEGYDSCADFIDRSRLCRQNWDANPWVWVIEFKKVQE